MLIKIGVALTIFGCVTILAILGALIGEFAIRLFHEGKFLKLLAISAGVALVIGGGLLFAAVLRLQYEQ